MEEISRHDTVRCASQLITSPGFVEILKRLGSVQPPLSEPHVLLTHANLGTTMSNINLSRHKSNQMFGTHLPPQASFNPVGDFPTVLTEP